MPRFENAPAGEGKRTVSSVARAWPAASDSVLKGFARDPVQPAVNLFPVQT